MTTYPSSPVDSRTAATLALIAGDPLHATDRELIVRAVHAEAAENAGVIDPNRLRARLTGEHGLVVYPARIGATIQSLKKAGVIEFEAWVINADKSGNAGKPQTSYRLTTRAQEAA